MNIKIFLEGGNFADYTHVVVFTRSPKMDYLGGGHPCDVKARFGYKEIERVLILDNVLRIQV